LLARIDTGKNLDEEKLNYLDGIPPEYKLLYEFLSQSYSNRYLPTSIKVALTNIGKNINLINIESIQREFAKTNNGKNNIAVYLYEDFLSQYDKLRQTEKRKEGGVYYTPAEATTFITRGVEHLIKTKFNLPKGFNSPNVKILDFACGTGTFLHSIFEAMIPQNLDDLTKLTLKEKITKDIYGFELLFTPYIIAHTILARFLKEKGINIGAEKLGVYLTNTLDISQHSISEMLPILKKEYEKAQNIKEQEQILAIVGNPPYFNGKSQAEKGMIDDKLFDYKKGLNERKINLDDMYIKFIRFAEWKIEKCGYGIVGIITNNSYLDGITHRKMREHLYNTFDEIYIVNLHGNSRKGETDKNIFDIMVGVSIVFFVKHKVSSKQDCKVFYFSSLNNNLILRQEKLDFLEKTKFKNINWKQLNPKETENFWFTDKDLSQTKEYDKFFKLTDIFSLYNSGIQTKKDDFVIQYERNKVDDIINDFKELSNEQIKNKYTLTDGGWTIQDAYKSLLKIDFDKKFIKQIQYRPFDCRWTFLHQTAGFLARPRYNVSSQFDFENLGLCFTRDVQGNGFENVFVSDSAMDLCYVNHNTYLAPLYTYMDDMQQQIKTPNFTKEFTKNYLDNLSFNKPKPEEILAYIYAVLHSPVYRKKYIEFLKTDFPAVPLTKDKNIFYQYAKLGQKLIDLHLLKNLPQDDTIKVSFSNVSNNFTLKKIFHAGNKLELTTTEGIIISIEGVNSEVYSFEIGSYKPIEKWLKYRIKDVVVLNTAKDLTHIKNMIIAIKNTIEIMREIETLGEKYLQGL
jgi:predicted helicase